MKEKEESFHLVMKTTFVSALIRYHIPRSWFKPSGNILVIFEEKGGDPTKIRFSRRKISGLCGHIAEDYPLFGKEPSEYKNKRNKATVNLKCPKSTRISSVRFASFGTPTGTCGFFSLGDCHDPNSISVVEKVKTALSALNFLKEACFIQL